MKSIEWWEVWTGTEATANAKFLLAFATKVEAMKYSEKYNYHNHIRYCKQVLMETQDEANAHVLAQQQAEKYTRLLAKLDSHDQETLRAYVRWLKENR